MALEHTINGEFTTFRKHVFDQFETCAGGKRKKTKRLLPAAAGLCHVLFGVEVP